MASFSLESFKKASLRFAFSRLIVSSSEPFKLAQPKSGVTSLLVSLQLFQLSRPSLIIFRCSGFAIVLGLLNKFECRQKDIYRKYNKNDPSHKHLYYAGFRFTYLFPAVNAGIRFYRNFISAFFTFGKVHNLPFTNLIFQYPVLQGWGETRISFLPV